MFLVHADREKVALGSDADSQDRIDDDSDAFDEGEEVMGLGSDDEDASEDEEIMQEVLKKVPGLRKHVRMSRDEEESAPEDEEDVDVMAWGNRRDMYYDDDAEDDEDLADEEEQEALRLQRERLEEMDEGDFLDDSFAANIKKSGSKSGLQIDENRDRATVDKVNEELEKIDLKRSNSKVDAETIARDFSRMSKDELMQRIATESPELLDLLHEFKSKTKELHERVIPVLERVKSGDHPTDKGVSLLELKNQLLMSYLLNISFYLYMRASGKPVHDHPVIEKLVELRLYLEKIKPIEQKLKYQVDKLVKAAVTGQAGEEQDALNFKPNVDQLISKDADEAEDAMDGQDNKDDGVYRPPKIAPVRFGEDDTAELRRRKAADRQRRHAANSRLMKDLIEEMGDTPEEVRDAGNMLESNRTNDHQWEERIRAEEESMVRLPVSRADKKKMRQQSKLANELADLDDFGDYSVLDGLATEQEQHDALRKQTLRSIIGKSVSAGGESGGKRRVGGDDDVPYKEKKARLETRGEDYNTHLDEQPQGPVESDDEYYKEVTAGQTYRREAKEAAHSGRFEPMYDEDEGALGDDGKRQINYQIMKNKGLTPKRAKENRNPRVKRRKKYEKSMTKLKSFKSVMKDQNKPYAGEETGIKKNLARSVRFQ